MQSRIWKPESPFSKTSESQHRGRLSTASGVALIAILLCMACSPLALGADEGTPLAPARNSIASGPLRKNPANGRYFTDGSGKAIYLAGSHTWANMIDRGRLNPPGVEFDYAAYMRWMVDHNFNFMRLWTAELPNAGPGPDYSEGAIVALPWKWRRTGPGVATDGGPKFDLSKLDQTYFDRMRERTIIAGKNGIYVSVMLFNGYEWQFDTNPKDGDPFVATNNINHISCPGTCPQDSAVIPAAVWEIEAAYIRKVIDTVNDLDNVLYEVSNEAGSPYSDDWQVHVINFVKQYEATKPKQHPVGMTFQWQGGSGFNSLQQSGGLDLARQPCAAFRRRQGDHQRYRPCLRLGRFEARWRDRPALVGLGGFYLRRQRGLHGPLSHQMAGTKLSRWEYRRSGSRRSGGQKLGYHPRRHGQR